MLWKSNCEIFMNNTHSEFDIKTENCKMQGAI